MNNALVEHVARALVYAETGRTLPPNTALTPGEAEVLAAYGARADAALLDVRCRLVGRDCTCWTFEAVIAADRRRADGTVVALP